MTDQTKRAIVQHTRSGEVWVVELGAVWDEDECIGSEIIGVHGPIYVPDIHPEGGPLEPSRELFDRIDYFNWEFSDEDVDWLRAEEDAGRLVYPIGIR